MIPVQRSEAPVVGPSLRAEKMRLAEYVAYIQANTDASTEHEIYVSRSFHPKSIKDIDENWVHTLIQQFHGKCAYCETPVGMDGQVDRFRPFQSSRDSGSKYQFHYVWLAYDWDNLLIACKRCNANKSSQFPVTGNRGRFATDISREHPLLVNPYVDNPEEHFFFSSDGHIMPKSMKGSITIDILDLNRTELMSNRRNRVEEFATILSSSDARDVTLPRHLSTFVMPDQPFSAVCKQYLAHWISSLISREARAQILTDSEWRYVLRTVYGRFSTQKELMDRFTQLFDQFYEAPSLVKNFGPRRQIRKIKISNVRGISLEHTFDFEDKSSWLMILGENGTGKTTVLQAITMALIKNWSYLDINPETFLPRPGDSASVRIEFDGESEAIELSLSSDDIEHYYPLETAPVVIGYGAIRLLPKSRRKTRKLNVSNVRSLFPGNKGDYFIEHPVDWLQHAQDIRYTAQTILDVLPFEDDEKVHMILRGKDVRIVRNGRELKLHELSSGYQSIIAITVDIMRSLDEASASGKLRDAVVLIDELDAHLHPTWKMRIVSQLRRAFPDVNFIVTTHEPLCLRGMKEGEVVVIQNVGEENIAVSNVPYAAGLRIDQILTSELFGMSSTLDPEIDDIIRRYQDLLNKDHKNEEDMSILRNLERRLNQPLIKYLGYTNRERLMYQVIDEYIASQKAKHEPYHYPTTDVQKKLLKIWGASEEEINDLY